MNMISHSRRSPPPPRRPRNNGWTLEWTFNNLVSDFDIGVQMPKQTEPGSARQPDELLCTSFVAILLHDIGRPGSRKRTGICIQCTISSWAPVSFRSTFYLHIWWIIYYWSYPSSSRRLFRWLSLPPIYIERPADRFAVWVGIAQFVFLVLFSYAFFFEGYTGLVITIGAILTLAIMMQLTAKVDWAEVFRRKETKSQAAD